MSNTRTARPTRRAAAEPPTPARRRTARTPEAEEPETPDAADAQEAEADGDYITAALAGEPIRIIPPAAWRMSWQRALRAGDIDAFASKVLHPDDVEIFEEIDPTNEEFFQFVEDASALAGEPMGKSHGPSRSSRNTRRR